jgi:hypothetical protein
VWYLPLLPLPAVLPAGYQASLPEGEAGSTKNQFDKPDLVFV